MIGRLAQERFVAPNAAERPQGKWLQVRPLDEKPRRVALDAGGVVERGEAVKARRQGSDLGRPDDPALRPFVKREQPLYEP